jgi:hypothetical protein
MDTDKLESLSRDEQLKLWTRRRVRLQHLRSAILKLTDEFISESDSHILKLSHEEADLTGFIDKLTDSIKEIVETAEGDNILIRDKKKRLDDLRNDILSEVSK